MPTYRVYITYSLPEHIDVEADDEDEAIDIVSGELGGLVDLDRVKFEFEEPEEGEDGEEEELD
jgi:hypothetical protein